MTSKLEEKFNNQLLSIKDIPKYERQFGFASHIDRRFLADFAWPKYMILVEIHGGTYTRKGHASGQGMQSDIDKLNLATILGYRVFTFTARDIRTEWAVCMIEGLFVTGCTPPDWSYRSREKMKEKEIRQIVKETRERRLLNAIQRSESQAGISKAKA